MNRMFGKILEARRKEQTIFTNGIEKPWSQKKLAEVSGVGWRTIGEIERGKKAKLEIEDLDKLATALKLSVLERREFYEAAYAADRGT